MDQIGICENPKNLAIKIKSKVFLYVTKTSESVRKPNFHGCIISIALKVYCFKGITIKKNTSIEITIIITKTKN